MIMLPDYDIDNFANDKSLIVACNLCIPIYCANVHFCHTTNVPVANLQLSSVQLRNN